MLTPENLTVGADFTTGQEIPGMGNAAGVRCKQRPPPTTPPPPTTTRNPRFRWSTTPRTLTLGYRKKVSLVNVVVFRQKSKGKKAKKAKAKNAKGKGDLQ